MQKAGEPENDAGFPKHKLAIVRVSPYVHSTCTSYVLNTYLYCVYALVGGAISIRDPYICAVSRVCAKESHAVFHRPVVCAVKT